jgi:hypothetical protein
MSGNSDSQTAMLPLGERTLAKDMQAALKAIHRWCNNRSVGQADIIRAIRLVSQDYLKRSGTQL